MSRRWENDFEGIRDADDNTEENVTETALYYQLCEPPIVPIQSKRKYLSYEAKMDILSVYNKFKSDGEEDPLLKTVEVTKIPQSTLRRMVKFGPKKRKERWDKGLFEKLTPTHADLIRKKLDELHKNNTVPTISIVYDQLTADGSIRCCQSTLDKFMKSNGFLYKRVGKKYCITESEVIPKFRNICKQTGQTSGEGSSSAASVEINKDTRVGNLPPAEVNFEDNADDQRDNLVKVEADEADVYLGVSKANFEDNTNELEYDPLDCANEVKTEIDEIDIKEELLSPSPINSVHAKRKRLDIEHASMDFTDPAKPVKNPLQEDEDLAFFYSLLPSVRSLNTDQKFTFRWKTIQLLQDIRNSLRIDASTETDFNM